MRGCFLSRNSIVRVGTLRFAHPTGRGGAGDADAGEQLGSGFVGRVLRDQLAGEGVFQDGLAQGGGAGEFGLAPVFEVGNF